MKIQDIEIKKIKPYEKNAKKHDETQIQNVMESIKQFGFAQPLVVDKENVLIIGHCRLIAAKRLKMTTVPVLRMEDLTEEQAAKLRLLDNKLNESEWDLDLLQEEIESLDFDGFDDEPKEEKKKPKREKTPMRYHTIRAQEMYEKKRFYSEKALLDNFEWHLKDGCVYCIISGGDVDQLTFLKLVIRNQPLKYCLLSSWCFGIEDVQEIGQWVKKGLIKRVDFYTGEIARASYEMCTRDLSNIARSTGGRCAVFRNHSKVILAYGSLYTCAIVSSANVNTNPRTENTTIICSREVADFYKDFFDDIIPFNKGFENWKPAKI